MRWNLKIGLKKLTLLAALILFLAYSVVAGADDSWLSKNWLYRKAVQLSNDNLVSANSSVYDPLLNFTVMIQLNADNFDFSKVQALGQDLRFTSSDGVTLLKYEVEKWDAANKKAVLWVRVPKIETDPAKSWMNYVYVYYGNAKAASGQTTQHDVWDSNYTNVLHMTQNSAFTINDSTGNPFSSGATYYTGATAATSTAPAVTGVIGDAVKLDGLWNYLTVKDQRTDLKDMTTPAEKYLEYTGNEMTVSLWVSIDPNELVANTTNKTAGGKILSKMWAGNGKYNYYITYNSDQTITMQISGSVGWSQKYDKIKIPADNSWHLLTAVIDASRNVTLYLDSGIDLKQTYPYVTMPSWAITPCYVPDTMSSTNSTLYPTKTAGAAMTPAVTAACGSISYVFNGSSTTQIVSANQNSVQPLVLGSLTGNSLNPATITDANMKDYTGRAVQGTMDEVRYSKAVRSQTWITASYLSDTNQLVSEYGDEEYSGPPPPTPVDSYVVTAGDQEVAEPNGSVTIPVILSGTIHSPVTFSYTTNDGTAIAGTDYTAANGTLVWQPGETAKSISIPVAHIAGYQGDRHFSVNLFNDLQGVLTSSVTIMEDEEAPADQGSDAGDQTSPKTSTPPDVTTPAAGCSLIP
jgi:hypothetical protein